MPNHVHVLVTPHEGWPLPTVLHTWKSYTANMVNQRLGKAGELWMEETFDHIVRSQIQLGHYRNYIRENPVKAHLKLEEYTFWEHDSE